MYLSHQIKTDKAINPQASEGCRKVKVFESTVNRVSHVLAVVAGSLKSVERGLTPSRSASINPLSQRAGHRAAAVISALTH